MATLIHRDVDIIVIFFFVGTSTRIVDRICTYTVTWYYPRVPNNFSFFHSFVVG